MKKKISLFLVVLILSAGFYVSLIRCTNHILSWYDRKNYEPFLNGTVNTFYTPLLDGLPWEVYTVYKQPFELKNKKNILLLGASTTRLGIIPEFTTVPSEWTLFNFAFMADVVESYKILINLLHKCSSHQLDFSDLVIIHIWTGTFRTRPLAEDLMKSRIEMFSLFAVDENLRVSGSPSSLAIQWKLMNFRIRFALTKPFFDAQTAKELIDLVRIWKFDVYKCFRWGKFPPAKVLARERILEYEAHWKRITQGASFPGPATRDFESFLQQLKKHTNVAVVNMYEPSWKKPYESYIAYNRWLKGSFSQFLQEQNIPFIDLSESIPDDEIGDGAHLFLQGRKRFTALFNDVMKNLIAELK